MTMNPIIVAYYSVHGATQALAHAIASGIESQQCEALIRQFPRVSDNLSTTQDAVPEQGAPYLQLDELSRCSGLALGSPTRFGNMAAPVKYFLDQTVKSWISGHLIGKPAAVFTSSSSMHGGQESTLLSMQIPLLHHGMLICGLPYSEPTLHSTQTGGSPYGATHVATNDNPNLSDDEITLAKALGKRLAKAAHALDAKDI